MESLVAAILISLCLIIFVYSQIVKDFWNPLVLFVYPLVCQYLLYMCLYSSEIRISDKTNILVLFGIISFILGYLSIALKLSNNIQDKINNEIFYNKNIEFILFIVAMIFIFFAFCDLLNNKIYGIYGDNYIRNIRHNMLYDKVEGQFFYKYGPFILYALCLLEFEKVLESGRYLKRLFFLIFILYSTNIFYMARTAILQYTLSFAYLTFIYINNKSNKYIKMKSLLYSILCIFIVFFLFDKIALYLVKIGSVSYLSKDYYVYKYIAYPLVTFDRYVINNPLSTSGYFILGPIGKILKHIGIYPDDILKRGFDIPPTIFNVTSYLQAPYNDFGTIGIIVVTFLLGLISGFIYKQARKKGHYWRLFYANYIYSIVISFFAYQFSMTSHVYLLCLFLLLRINSKGRGKRHSSCSWSSLFPTQPSHLR